MLYLIFILKWTLFDMNLALLFHLMRGVGRVVLCSGPCPPSPTIFWQISYLYSNQDGQNMPTKLMLPPSRFLDLPLPLERDLAKRKRQLAAYLKVR